MIGTAKIRDLELSRRYPNIGGMLTRVTPKIGTTKAIFLLFCHVTFFRTTA